MLVGVDEQGLALALRNGYRNDFFGEDAVLLCCDCTLMGLNRECILILAADGELGAQVLCRFDHSAGNREVTSAGCDAGARETIAERNSFTLDAQRIPVA